MRDTVKIEKGNTLMVAHQGGTVAERGNTLPAFQDMAKRSFFGAECDIHVTKDKRFVVYHNNKTGEDCDREIDIESSTLEEIREVNILPENHDAVYSGNDMKIPTLEEYLEICKSADKYCIIELKNRFATEDVALVIDVIRGYDCLDKVIFISFSLENCVALRSLLPKQKIQYLVTIGRYNDSVLEALDKYGLDLDINIYEVNQQIVDDVHAHGHEINLWTCDDAEQAKPLLALGVEYFTTNRLE